MFLSTKYVLANELAQKMGISIANISMLRKEFEEGDDLVTLYKMNNCTFIKDSHKLPKNLRVGLKQHKFTDMSDKLPCSYVRSEHSLTEKEWFDSGVVIDKVKVAGKEFYVFSADFVKKARRKILYVLNEKEKTQCFEKGQIDGFIQASKNKFITWY